ncbi:hypothetical protein NEHOM01_1751 [Nematocida homosporus]|uniref:uncharacterized protein n=1 Tax=Nematocida homosporus TaxID=1912981 RepID=UPI00221EB4E4|nr:uncharacterized protein NEHOM01_1751 [Nematocida homosporus]KAI5186856.1 hypothetical protein NEHOM01_1751 [Nematocida homosporus]
MKDKSVDVVTYMDEQGQLYGITNNGEWVDFNKEDTVKRPSLGSNYSNTSIKSTKPHSHHQRNINDKGPFAKMGFINYCSAMFAGLSLCGILYVLCNVVWVSLDNLHSLSYNTRVAADQNIVSALALGTVLFVLIAGYMLLVFRRAFPRNCSKVASMAYLAIGCVVTVVHLGLMGVAMYFLAPMITKLAVDNTVIMFAINNFFMITLPAIAVFLMLIGLIIDLLGPRHIAPKPNYSVAKTWRRRLVIVLVLALFVGANIIIVTNHQLLGEKISKALGWMAAVTHLPKS